MKNSKQYRLILKLEPQVEIDALQNWKKRLNGDLLKHINECTSLRQANKLVEKKKVNLAHEAVPENLVWKMKNIIKDGRNILLTSLKILWCQGVFSLA